MNCNPLHSGRVEQDRFGDKYPASWVEEFPNGTIALHVKRSGDGAVYQAQNITDDRESRRVTWTITPADLDRFIFTISWGGKTLKAARIVLVAFYFFNE